MVPFDYQLENGEIVEVITSKSAKGPSRDWLNICKSNEARNKIRQWFKKERREENIATGRAAFESELKHARLSLAAITAEDVLPHILQQGAFQLPGRAVRLHRLRRHHRRRRPSARIQDELLRLGRLKAEKAAAAGKALEDSVIVPGSTQSPAYRPQPGRVTPTPASSWRGWATAW